MGRPRGRTPRRDRLLLNTGLGEDLLFFHLFGDNKAQNFLGVGFGVLLAPQVVVRSNRETPPKSGLVNTLAKLHTSRFPIVVRTLQSDRDNS